MTQAIVGLTAGLYTFIIDSEAPLSAKKATLEDARERIAQAAERLARRIAEDRERVVSYARAQLDEVVETLAQLRAELAERQPAQDRLEGLWKGLGNHYEALRAHVRRLRLPVPHEMVLGPVKPRNLARNAFHVIMALTAVFTYELLTDRTGVIIISGTILALFTGMEILRRVSTRWNERFVEGAFKAIARPGEAHEVPAATWYIAALFIGVIVLPQRAIELGTLALGFGDPIAQIVGKRFGKKKIIGQKSWAGAIAFFALATLAGFVFLSLTGAGADALGRLGIAAAVGLAAALAELFSGPVDDNFSIPLVGGAVAALLLT